MIARAAYEVSSYVTSNLYSYPWYQQDVFHKADKYRSRKQIRVFQHFGRLFLPGTLENVPCSLNEPLVNFREESINSGIGRFCRLELQRMANWPSFDQKIETGRIMRNRRPVSCNSPCFDQKRETGRVGHPLELSSLQNRPIPRGSFRKLTNSSLRQQRTFFNVPARKSLPKC